MNRTDLILLAEARIEDAKILLQARRWAAAYYLLGYAVECGLKACAARQFRQDEVPDKTLVNDFYSHRLDKLLAISGVKAELERRANVETAFEISWNTVRDWSESSRYEPSMSEAKAQDMLNAVADPKIGVGTWLSTQW
ncbi:MAG: HEPN domain-containing protein [Bryobacterales bacterium]|nr:HEPN domain-containing protein [Bryobacterales bacterium]